MIGQSIAPTSMCLPASGLLISVPAGKCEMVARAIEALLVTEGSELCDISTKGGPAHRMSKLSLWSQRQMQCCVGLTSAVSGRLCTVVWHSGLVHRTKALGEWHAQPFQPGIELLGAQR